MGEVWRGKEGLSEESPSFPLQYFLKQLHLRSFRLHMADKAGVPEQLG